MHRKYIDMVSVQVNEKSRNTKKWLGVRRRFVIRYRVRLNPIAVRILLGRSQIMEASVCQLKQIYSVIPTYRSLQQKDGKRHTWPASLRLAVVRTVSISVHVGHASWASKPGRTSNALAKAANRIAKKSRAPRL